MESKLRKGVTTIFQEIKWFIITMMMMMAAMLIEHG